MKGNFLLLADFMGKKGYSFEAQYIRVIWNWHHSCDERGLSELQRCRFNYELLNYYPRHTTLYDLSTLEVTRLYTTMSALFVFCTK